MPALKWCFTEIWETIADEVPDAIALINGDVRRTWRDYEDRAARIASALVAQGLGTEFKAGLYGHNSNEYLESQFGIVKAGGVPINVNYRYADAELAYLLENSDSEALFFDAQFGARVAAISSQLPKLKLLVEIDDGSGHRLASATPLETLVAAHAPLPRRAAADDAIYMMYTGGTTGLPKGVMYRQADFNRMVANMAARDGSKVPETTEELAASVREAVRAGRAPISLAACPIMHATGLWLGVFVAHARGGAAVTMRNERFDPDGIWTLVEKEQVQSIAIVGDAFAKPMLQALRQAKANGRPYDLSSLKQIGSSGVMFSREVKEGLLEFADIRILDAMGSSEGSIGASVVSRTAPPGQTALFDRNVTTKVFNERDEEVRPGSDEIGLLADGGFTPIGYYKDAEKTARTFRIIDGHRYAFPGDFAKVAADGSLILLGRGSQCINTGGEKVFPEEVEEALKAHASVYDCLVVGVPDERFGEQVTAVVSLQTDQPFDEQQLIDFVRAGMARYKAPKRVFVVDAVARAPNGKADYKWAKDVALARALAGDVQ